MRVATKYEGARTSVRALALAVMLCGRAALAGAQLAGPPAGVPVPPAPVVPVSATAQPATPLPLPGSDGSAHFRVRLLNGRDGTPLRGEQVRLWYDEMDGPGYLLMMDAQGEALMPDPPSEPIRLLLRPESLYDCRKLSVREPMPGYNLKETATKGMLTGNRCGAGVRAVPHPGELTLFGRPLRWYEQLNRP